MSRVVITQKLSYIDIPSRPAIMIDRDGIDRSLVSTTCFNNNVHTSLCDCANGCKTIIPRRLLVFLPSVRSLEMSNMNNAITQCHSRDYQSHSISSITSGKMTVKNEKQFLEILLYSSENRIPIFIADFLN